MRSKIAVLLSAVLMLLANVAGVAAEEGVTDTEIHLGTFGPLTGPAAAWAGVIYGLESKCKLINENGGIHGRKIVLHILDDQYNPAKTKAGVKQLQESVGIFAWVGGIGTTTSLSVMDYLVGKGVPWFGSCSGSEELIDPPKRTIFAQYPINSREAAVLCRYVVETMGLKKVAMAYQNDPYGLNGLKGAKEELARHQIELAAAIPVAKNDSNMVAVANKLRQSNAEAVLIWLNNLSALQVLQASKKMNYTPQWLAPISFTDFKVTYEISRGLIEGMIVDSILNLNSPMIATYQEAHQRLGRKGVAWTEYVGYGFAFGEGIEEALTTCGRNLTRENLILAGEKIRNNSLVGGLFEVGPFNAADPESRNGIRKVYLKQCLKGGDSKVLTDWMPLQ